VQPEPVALDIVDRDTPCFECKRTKPLNDSGICADCFVSMQPAVLEPAAESSIGSALGSIAAQASADANRLNLGTVANGRASLGVGFRNADGYIEALRRGVTQTTLDEYTSTLRSHYGYTVSVAIEDGRYLVKLSMSGKPTEMIEASIMTLVANAAPEVVTPEQLEAQRQNREAMQAIKAAARERKAKAAAAANAEKAVTAALSVESSETRSDVSRKLHEQQLFSVVDAKHVGALFGFNGEGRLTRQQIADAWKLTGLPEDWMIKSKTPRAHAGRAVAVLKRVGIQVFPEKKGEREAEEKKTGVVEEHDHAWFVGSIARRARVGEKLGDTELVVKLTGDQLTFEGSAEMAEKVRAEFEKRTATELYESTWIRNWLSDDIFKAKLDAVDYNSCGMYVPRQNVATATKIVQVFSATGWGTGWVGTERRPAIKLLTSADLSAGLCAGLEDEVERRLSELTKHRDDVRLKSKTGDIGKVAAANYLRDLREIGKRVCAYSLMLGEQRSEQLWSRIKDAMAEVEAIVDDPIIERFALIREEIEADRMRERGVIEADDE
jgi:hypothetical protein